MEKQVLATKKLGLKSPSNPIALIAAGYGDEEDSDNDIEETENVSGEQMKTAENAHNNPPANQNSDSSQIICEGDMQKIRQNSR